MRRVESHVRSRDGPPIGLIPMEGTGNDERRRIPELSLDDPVD
jgi:hypothetical protein